MKLKTFYSQADYDALDEKVQSFYVQSEEEDGWMLDVTPVNGITIANVSKQQSALQEERKSRRDAEKKLKDFEGIDPKAARDALAKIEKFGEEWDPDERTKEALAQKEKQLHENFDRKLEAETRIHKAQIEELTKENEVMDTQLRTVLVDQELTSAINGQGGKVRKLLPIAKASCRVVRREDGTRAMEILDDAGNPRLSLKDPTKNMSASEYITEFKADEDFATDFGGSGASGAGTPPGGQGTGGGGGRPSSNPFLTKSWNLTAQAQLAQTDPNMAKRLQSQAISSEPGGRAEQLANASGSPVPTA